MSEEKIQVLRLLEQGRINYEEALALLQALEGAAGKREVGAREQVENIDSEPVAFEQLEDDIYDHDAECWQPALNELGQGLHTLGAEISSEVRDALQEAGREINSALSEVGEELREAGREINIAGLFQGLLGTSWGPHHAWQQEKQIVVANTINTLRLVVANRNGGLRLLPTDGEQIVVRLQLRLQAASEAEARELAEQGLHEQQAVAGEQLHLAWHVDEQVKGSISFEILVPRRLAVVFDLASKNGSILVKDVRAAGKAETKNGSVKIDGDSYGSLEVETKNGSIAVVAGIETLLATSKNGSISCTLEPLGSGQISLTAANGSVQAELACQADIGYEVDLQTRSGRLSADLPGLAVLAREKDYLSGSTSNWEQAPIKAQVTALSRNGSVSVRSK